MSALFWAVLGASLLGSLHCAGMCGGFVAFYAGGDRSSGLSRALSHAAYSLGRLLTYVLLGIMAGILGRALDLAGAAAGLQRGAAIAAGVLMMVWGLVMLLQVRGVRISTHLPPVFQRLVQEALGQLGDKPPVVKALTLGLLSTLLPCGWLYAFAITAAGTGDPVQGALVMAAFWLGTLPVLLTLGMSVQALAGPLRRHLPLVSALILLCIGAWTVLDRARIPVERFGGIRAAVVLESAEAPKAAGLKPWELPCCQDKPDSSASQ
ncbi:MAG: sulfite exporter TauE/SafE family protein [Candidatus Delongbacteria bacterium]